MSKQIRQQAIAEILSNRKVSSRSVLSAELNKMNFDVSQDILSKDLLEMKIVRCSEGYIKPHVGAENVRLVPDPLGTMKRAVVDMIEADNVLVIKTIPGNAPPVALIIESTPYDEVKGTIGGKDTVFAVTGSAGESAALKEKLIGLIATQ